jgi:hypothetical protein
VTITPPPYDADRGPIEFGTRVEKGRHEALDVREHEWALRRHRAHATPSSCSIADPRCP